MKIDNISPSVETNIEDDLMNPIFPEKSIVKVEKIGDVSNGYILVLELDNTKLIRRYFEKGDRVFLFADNSKYEPIMVKKSEIKYLGKIRSVEIKL